MRILPLLLTLAAPASAHWTYHEPLSGHAYHVVTEADDGTLFSCVDNDELALPPPETGDYGTVGLVKESNTANFCSVVRTDDEPLFGFRRHSLVMFGDRIEVTDIGDRYLVTGQGQVITNGMRGTHRTIVGSLVDGSYFVRCTDRGAILRVVADMGMNIYLPTNDARIPQATRDCMFTDPEPQGGSHINGGYRNGWQVCISLVPSETVPSVHPHGFVVVWALGSGINEHGEYIVLRVADDLSRHVCLDFDSAGWRVITDAHPMRDLGL